MVDQGYKCKIPYIVCRVALLTVMGVDKVHLSRCKEKLQVVLVEHGIIPTDEQIDELIEESWETIKSVCEPADIVED